MGTTLAQKGLAHLVVEKLDAGATLGAYRVR